MLSSLHKLELIDDGAIDQILSKSIILNNLLDSGSIGIVGGVYKVEDGSVTFFKEIFK